MIVTVDFMGPVLRPKGHDGKPIAVEIDAGTTAENMLLSMGYQPTHVRAIGVFRDGLRLPPSAPMIDGETVTISVPFGGG